MFRKSIKKAIKADYELIRRSELLNEGYKIKNKNITEKISYIEKKKKEKIKELKNDLITILSVNLSGLSKNILKLLAKNPDIDPELFLLISENLRINENKLIDKIERSDDKIRLDNPNLDNRKLEIKMNEALKEIDFYVAHKKNDYGDFDLLFFKNNYLKTHKLKDYCIFHINVSDIL